MSPPLSRHYALLFMEYRRYGLVVGDEFTSGFKAASRESGALLHARGVFPFFEQAWFLLAALARRDEVGFSRCRASAGCNCAARPTPC